MTGEYTPGLPRLRDLVDALAEGDVGGRPVDAAHRPRCCPTRPDVLAHHAAFARAWNAALDEPRGRHAAPEVAERLREVEAGFEAAGSGSATRSPRSRSSTA
jgi:hypothetical protein